jgi:hypothetical protein
VGVAGALLRGRRPGRAGAFLQLYVFRRFDFASMYAFRLVYYAYWHILWGVIRLKVLF